MTTHRFNISKPEKYTDRSGTEKTKWNQIGTLTEFEREDGSISRLIEIPAIGLVANAFPWKAPESRQTHAEPETVIDADSGDVRKPSDKPAQNTMKSAVGSDSDQIQYPVEDINPDDIPF